MKDNNVSTPSLSPNTEEPALYWVKFVDQETGHVLDNYFKARSITQLDEGVGEFEQNLLKALEEKK